MLTLNSQAEKTQREEFKLRFLSLRLSNILPKTLCENDLNKPFFFFTTQDLGLFKPGSPSLVFMYDNGVSLERGFSGKVLGRLYLSKEGDFSLATWPAPDLWDPNGPPPLQNQVLLDQVEELSFQFYTPPDRTRIAAPPVKGPGKADPQPRGIWAKAWSAEFGEIPAIVKVKVQRKSELAKEPAVFVFPLNNCNQTVLYNS